MHILLSIEEMQQYCVAIWQYLLMNAILFSKDNPWVWWMKLVQLFLTEAFHEAQVGRVIPQYCYSCELPFIST